MPPNKHSTFNFQRLCHLSPGRKKRKMSLPNYFPCEREKARGAYVNTDAEHTPAGSNLRKRENGLNFDPPETPAKNRAHTRASERCRPLPAGGGTEERRGERVCGKETLCVRVSGAASIRTKKWIPRGVRLCFARNDTHTAGTRKKRQKRNSRGPETTATRWRRT